MSPLVAEAVAELIHSHCLKHDIDTFVVEIHGGEPLLLGPKRFRAILDILLKKCTSARLVFLLQTNGLLLNEEWLELFARYGVRFGVSVDGAPERADLQRVYSNGNGSTQDLLDRIAQLRIVTPLFEKQLSGALCVIDPQVGGASMIKWMIEHDFRSFDFLLPDATYVNLPANWNGPTEYGRFLIEAFDYWRLLGVNAPRIRRFELMMLGLLGQPPQLDSLGGDIRSLCVVETNGSIGILDTLRICGGIYATDVLSVFDDDLDTHSEYYSLGRMQTLSKKCTSCEYLSACGGGYLPHRYDGDSFQNPSLYCDALYALADHMMITLKDTLPASVWA